MMTDLCCVNKEAAVIFDKYPWWFSSITSSIMCLQEIFRPLENDFSLQSQHNDFSNLIFSTSCRKYIRGLRYVLLIIIGFYKCQIEWSKLNNTKLFISMPQSFWISPFKKKVERQAFSLVVGTPTLLNTECLSSDSSSNPNCTLLLTCTLGCTSVDLGSWVYVPHMRKSLRNFLTSTLHLVQSQAIALIWESELVRENVCSSSHSFPHCSLSHTHLPQFKKNVWTYSISFPSSPESNIFINSCLESVYNL